MGRGTINRKVAQFNCYSKANTCHFDKQFIGNPQKENYLCTQ